MNRCFAPAANRNVSLSAVSLPKKLALRENKRRCRAPNEEEFVGRFEAAPPRAV